MPFRKSNYIGNDIDKLINLLQGHIDNSTCIEIQKQIDIKDDPSIHVHPLWELKIFLNGKITIVPPGVPHYSRITELRQAMVCNSDSFRIGEFLLFCRKQDKYFPALLSMFEIYCELPQTDTTLLTSASKDILIILIRLSQMIKNEPKILANLSYFDRALFFIQQHYWDCNIGLTEIAEFSGCSAQYLSKIFQEKLKKTPREALLDLRMKHAFNLLNSGKYLISEVARLTGYRTQFYFSNVFREYFGVSPITVRDRQEQIICDFPDAKI